MSYYCPECGAPAKRKNGATEQKEGIPVFCPEHGRVFVNTNKLPILSFLSKPLSTPKSYTKERILSASRKWKERNKEIQKQYHKDRWQKLKANPELIAKRKLERAGYWQRYRLVMGPILNERRRQKRKQQKEAACQE